MGSSTARSAEPQLQPGDGTGEPRRLRQGLLSVIVPVYNEHESIEAVIEQVLAAPLPAGWRREIIAVDDGSTDGTRERLESLAHLPELRVERSIRNRGKGTAIRIGIQHAVGELILIQDADLEYDPNDYPALLEPLLSGEADAVYGSRFLGSIEGMRWPYRLANRILAGMVRVLYRHPLTDEATAYKVFRSEVLKNLTLNCRRFEFCPEVTAKVLRAGGTIREVPISYRARSLAQGKKIRFSDALMAAWTLLRYRWF